MIHPKLGLYPSTRWAFVVTGAFLTFALSPLGPGMWRNTPSLRLLHALMPFWLLASFFLIYTLLHLVSTLKMSELGCWLGLALYGLGLFALIVTTRVDRPTNPLAIVAVLLAAVLHYAAGRNVTISGYRQ